MDRDFLIDLFADFGPVTIRRMFSGFGISADGINFALALRGRSLFPRRRTDHSAIRGGGIEAVSVSTENDGEDRHRQLVLAIAGAAIRRFRGVGCLGEGVFGCGAARGAPQASKDAQRCQGARQEGQSKNAGSQESRGEEKMVSAEGGAAKEALILRSARPRASRRMAASEVASWFSRRCGASSGDAPSALLSIRFNLRRPGSGPRRRIPGRLRRQRGCGRCAWRRRDRRPRVRSVNRYRRPASASTPRPKW